MFAHLIITVLLTIAIAPTTYTADQIRNTNDDVGYMNLRLHQEQLSYPIEDTRLQEAADVSLQHAFIRSEIIRCFFATIKQRMQQAEEAMQKQSANPLAPKVPYLVITRSFTTEEHGELAKRVLTLAKARTDIADHTVKKHGNRYHGDTEIANDLYCRWIFNTEGKRILECQTYVYSKETIEKIIAEEEKALY